MLLIPFVVIQGNNNADDCTAEFLRVKEAYEVLRDTSSRQVYDECRHRPEYQFRRNRYSAQTASRMVDKIIRRCDEAFTPLCLFTHSSLCNSESTTEPCTEPPNPLAVCLTCDACGAPS